MVQIILAEKPAAGIKIKDALDRPTISATGHLLELEPESRGWIPPYFNLIWRVSNKKKGEVLAKIIKKLQEADEICIATDYDPEGQLIAYNILREAGISTSDVLRMKFSSLETDEIVKSYQNPLAFDDQLAISAEVRHYLDWYFGMNLSKILTQKLKTEGSQRKFFLTPVGRVQTPVLNYLVSKEKEIMRFVDKEVYRVDIMGIYDQKYFDIGYITFEELAEAERFMGENEEGWIDEIEERKEEIVYLPPNKDYVVNRCLSRRISPDVVDYTLQDLYLDGYISYPRTVSQKYTGVDTQKYLKRMIDAFPEASKAVGREPREGDIEGVHPAIYPIRPYTDKDLSGVVFRIIVEAFVKCHLPPEIRIEKLIYVAFGERRYISSDNPDLNEGDTFDLKFSVEKTKTTPPGRFRPARIYEWMVTKNLGTVDTRSVILSDITKRWKGYAFETSEGLFASSKGMRIVDTLAMMYPAILDVDLTRNFEGYIESVRNGGLSRDEVLLKGRNTVTEIVEKIREEENGEKRGRED